MGEPMTPVLNAAFALVFWSVLGVAAFAVVYLAWLFIGGLVDRLLSGDERDEPTVCAYLYPSEERTVRRLPARARR